MENKTKKSGSDTPMQSIVHWIFTMDCWGAAALLLIYNAKKHLGFSLCEMAPTTGKGVAISAILAAPYI